jgi:hypothetical protein
MKERCLHHKYCALSCDTLKHVFAERRLLDVWVSQARRHGVRPHQFRSWIRRKTGPDIVVWRQRVDGTLGCATPCIFCQRELLRFDLRVHCSQAGQSWFSGRLDEAGAPESKPTGYQRKQLLRSHNSSGRGSATQPSRGGAKDCIMSSTKATLAGDKQPVGSSAPHKQRINRRGMGMLS